jgi:hypothetical protein
MSEKPEPQKGRRSGSSVCSALCCVKEVLWIEQHEFLGCWVDGIYDDFEGQALR